MKVYIAFWESNDSHRFLGVYSSPEIAAVEAARWDALPGHLSGDTFVEEYVIDSPFTLEPWEAFALAPVEILRALGKA